MAQADYIISNQTFPNTRADINSHLQAIATNNSGTSAPTTQYAGQFWIDTTSSTWTLYIHDGSDDIQFATIDTSANTVNFVDSALDVVTDTSPQLGGNLDLNSNDITGTGNINITGNLTSTGIDDNATSTAITIDSSERVGIGSTAPGTDASANADSLVIKKASGNVGMSIITDGSSNANIFLGDTSDSLNALVQFNDSANELRVGTSDGGGELVLNSGAGVEALRIDDTGNVGIGTSSPAYLLESVKTNSGSEASCLAVRNNATADNTSTSIYFVNSTDATSSSNRNKITSKRTSSGHHLEFHTNNGTLSERIRIDSSGRLLVGKTASNFNTVGAEIRNDGRIFGISSGNNPITLNRKTDDGTIIDLRKDGTEVGRIGTAGGDIVVGTGNIGLRFNDAANTVEPWDINSNNSENDTIDLGYYGGRFKDLYLGGGLYVGGTGTANKLDDYEEGTWTPVFADAISGGNSFTMQTIKGEYLKIGDYVKLLFYGRTNGSTTGITTSNQLFIQGLPFTVNTVNGSIVPVHASVLATVQSTLGTIFARALQSSSSMRIEKQYGDTTNPYSTQSLLISEWEGGSGATIEGSITYKV